MFRVISAASVVLLAIWLWKINVGSSGRRAARAAHEAAAIDGNHQ